MKKELIKMKKVFLIISIFLLGGAFSFSNENNPATIIEHYESKTVIVQDKVKENNEISETKEYYSNGKIKKETKIVAEIHTVRTHPEFGASFPFAEGQNDTLFIDMSKYEK